MASVRKRKYRNDEYRWVIDYKDIHGKRHLCTCPANWKKKQALEKAAELVKEPGGDPRRKFADVAGEWLQWCRLKVKADKLRPQSFADYEHKLAHVLPALGKVPASKIRRSDILEILTRLLKEGLSPRTVSEIRGRIHAVFSFAISREYVTTNPASNLGKDLALTKASSTETVRAFTDEQRAAFFGVANYLSDVHPIFFLLDRTGMRIGEATALMRTDVIYEKRQIQVSKTWVGGMLQEKTKTAAGHRSVDMSRQLCELLHRVEIDNKRRKLAEGWPTMPEWVFINRNGRHWQPTRVRARFNRILELAKLPSHFTPHSFRHTCAKRLLEGGASLAFVQRLLGHESMAITNDLYGRWAVIRDTAAVDRLDDGFEELQGRLQWEA